MNLAAAHTQKCFQRKISRYHGNDCTFEWDSTPSGPGPLKLFEDVAFVKLWFNSRKALLDHFLLSVALTALPKSHEGRLKLISPLHLGTARIEPGKHNNRSKKAILNAQRQTENKMICSRIARLVFDFRCTTFPLEFAALALISMTTAEIARDYHPIVPVLHNLPICTICKSCCTICQLPDWATRMHDLQIGCTF